MLDLDFKYKDLIKYLKKNSSFEPEIALVLGSGLGEFANNINVLKTISTSSIPDYPHSTVEGHKGKIHFAEESGKKLLLFQGRIHFYEGYRIFECVLPSFISYKLGCKKMFLTNAAGGISKNFKPADLMLASSFNGIGIKKELTELIGIAEEKKKNNFIDFPSQKFNNIILQSAKEENIDLKKGIYWHKKGPSYETPAEIKMIKKFGGDAVGMSTVHEGIFSAYLGMETASVSCITNYAAGISGQKLSHSDVTQTANLVKNKFERLVKKTLKNL
ncbi:MAG: purine-nucleoside phosphorylase [Ignavibacteriaceae bacterium]